MLSFLPVAHAFERTAGYYTIMTAGGTIAYAEGLTQIAQNLLEVEPTVVLTVPRLLEVIYSRIMRTVEAGSPMRQKLFHEAIATGARAAEYRHRGRRVPPHLAAAMALYRRLVFARIRSVFGKPLALSDFGRRPAPSRDQSPPRRRRSSDRRGLRPDRGVAGGRGQPPRPHAHRHRRASAQEYRGQSRGGRRTAAARSQCHGRLLQSRGRNPRGDRRRRLAAYRRHRANRRRRLHQASPTARRKSSSCQAARTSRRPISKRAWRPTRISRRRA